MAEKSAAGPVRSTVTRIIRSLDSAFSPLCPFIVRRFVEEVTSTSRPFAVETGEEKLRKTHALHGHPQS
ncbi:hypothetical protein D3C83_286240 [compost metagenome]